MYRVVVQWLSTRLPGTIPKSDIEAMARMIEMNLDGLMIALVMRKGPRELAESKRAWARFGDLLLAQVEEK